MGYVSFLMGHTFGFVFLLGFLGDICISKGLWFHFVKGIICNTKYLLLYFDYIICKMLGIQFD